MPAVSRSATSCSRSYQQILPPKQRKEAIPTYGNASKLKFSTQYVKKLAASQPGLSSPLTSHKRQNKGLINMLALTPVTVLVVILTAHFYHLAKQSYGYL
jgi:hypothetical protein